MKRFAIFVVLCVLAAAAAVGVQAWRWRERKLKEDVQNREQSAAENAAAGRLGLKTPPLPPHPLDRRIALDDALRLEPDRRFLLAARQPPPSCPSSREHWTRTTASTRTHSR